MLISCTKILNINLFNKYSIISSAIKINEFSTSSFVSNNETKKSSENFILSEDLPPIPPNYGFPGDENIRSIFEIKKIKSSFQYGNPPKIRRRFIRGPPVIRLIPITHCSNRKFYRIAVTRANDDLSDGFIEDLGSVDPMPNKENQILVALNIERIKHYLSKQVPIKGKALELLGLSGFLPVHPSSYLTAYRNRQKLDEQKKPDEVK